MNDHKIDVSIIIPVKDEEENIESLAHELTTVLEKQSWSWECIWVDDGSTDQGLVLLKRLAESDARYHYISFKRNEGYSAALWAGFQASKGQILATLDSDGQNDPADIPHCVEMVRSDQVDMVQGYRVIRKDNLVRRLSSRIAHIFRTWITGETVRDVGCATRAFKKVCVAYLPLFAGMHRFLPILVAMQGFRLIEVPVNHRPRLRGQSKYNIRNRLWVGLADAFGVLWLKKRSFQYTIVSGSDLRDE